jgi:glycosyltransferase involved in cell wall biosynthesis
MKILIINQHLSDVLGGSEMQCDLIARGLAGRGHQVVYGVVENRKKTYSDFPYTIIPLAIEKRGELTRLLQRERPDVIYWRFNKHHLLRAVNESRQEHIPFVFAVSHINDVKRFAYKSPLTRASGILSLIQSIPKITSSLIQSAWNYRAYRHVAAITLLNSQYLGWVPVKTQRVIWNAVSEEKEQFEWARQYCIWVANIKPVKQPEVYIELASQMSEKWPKIDFLMIGAIQSKQYEPIIKAAELKSNLHYIGFKSPELVNGALEKAVCLVHTCKPEGFGNNFIQAWMQGCPTITLNFDPDGIIQREHLGFVSGTIEQMVKDVEILLNDSKLRDEISTRAQSFAHENFTTRRMISEVESFLIQIVAEYRVRKGGRTLTRTL